MSRVVLLVCLLMLASVVVSLDLPGGLKPPGDLKAPDTPKLPDAGKDLPTKDLPNLGRK